jgi:hypothetical protein
MRKNMISKYKTLEEALAAAETALEDVWDTIDDGHVFRSRKDKLHAREVLSEAIGIVDLLRGEKL